MPMSDIAGYRRRKRDRAGRGAGRTALGLAVIVAGLFLAQPAHGHGGKPDGDGCTHNRKFGWYHCHRGPLAGLQFESKEAAMAYLQRLQQGRGQGRVSVAGGAAGTRER